MCQILILSAFEHRRQMLRERRSGIGALLFSGHALLCRVDDISPDGASIVTRDIPAVGENVRLDLPGIGRSVAKAARVAGDRLGVEFLEKAPT